MSQFYPDLNLTKYPNDIDDQRIFEDIGIDTVADMTKYYELINSRNFTAASQLLADNPRLLRCIVDALSLNTFEHRIIALERFYKSNFYDYIVNAITYKGSWLASVSYSKFDVCSYNGMTYMSIQTDIPNGTVPTNSSFFVPLSIKGEQGVSGLGLSPRGMWATTTQYHQYDLVSYENKLWFALKNNVGSMPNSSSSDWSLALESMMYGSETSTATTVVQPDGKIIVNAKNMPFIDY